MIRIKLIAILALASACCCDAFSPSSRSLAWTQAALQDTQSASFSSSCLRSSNDSFSDDELSKLIGKRNKIIRKKRDDEAEMQNFMPDSIKDSGAAAAAGTGAGSAGSDVLSDISLDNLPTFETKRPVRSSKKGKDEAAAKEQERSSRSDEPVIMDYMSDYDDENEFHIPNRIGFSTSDWGDATKGFVTSKKLNKQAIREGRFNAAGISTAYEAMLNEGICLVDVSPEYGQALASRKLSAEHILGRCIKEAEGVAPPLIAATYANKLWQRSAKGLVSSLASSCAAMDTSTSELVQVKTVGWLPSAGLVEGMNEAVAEVGNANYAGVKNVSPIRMSRIAKKLDNYGLILATNSFQFSLTNRKNERWINACKALGVIPLITNPTDDGLASAKYTATNPSGGVAGGASKYSFAQLEKYQPLHSVLETVAERVKTRVKRDNQNLKDRSRGRYGGAPKINTDITPFQVAINYVIAKGGVPLPEVNSPRDADAVKGCLGWSLADEEVSMLESAADLCK